MNYPSHRDSFGSVLKGMQWKCTWRDVISHWEQIQAMLGGCLVNLCAGARLVCNMLTSICKIRIGIRHRCFFLYACWESQALALAQSSFKLGISVWTTKSFELSPLTRHSSSANTVHIDSTLVQSALNYVSWQCRTWDGKREDYKLWKGYVSVYCEKADSWKTGPKEDREFNKWYLIWGIPWTHQGGTARGILVRENRRRKNVWLRGEELGADQTILAEKKGV